MIVLLAIGFVLALFLADHCVARLDEPLADQRRDPWS